jgi:transcriptional regulator with XRE-family HTH domain
MNHLLILGQQLKQARKQRFPRDTLDAFSVRIGVARATLQKMEKGDLSVALEKYFHAAEVLGVAKNFEQLFVLETSLFDD